MTTKLWNYINNKNYWTVNPVSYSTPWPLFSKTRTEGAEESENIIQSKIYIFTTTILQPKPPRIGIRFIYIYTR